MEQTFHDLLRERARQGGGTLRLALWLFAETAAGILREQSRRRIPMSKAVIRPAVATAVLLLIPLVAMRFGDDVDWSPGDFIVAGVLLFGSGLAYELMSRRAAGAQYKAAVGLAVASSLFLIWVNLAVGVIGSEDNPANLLYGGVLAVGFLGALLARFEPRGMARALFAMALTQAAVPVVASLAFRPLDETLVRLIGVNAFFVVLFLGAAILFRHAGADRESRPAVHS